MAAASASTAPPLGETPTLASSAPGPPQPPPPPDPLPSAARRRLPCRVREVSSRYLSAPLPAQARRLSTSSSHTASVPPPTPTQHRHRSTPAPATTPAPFVFGLADENRPPSTPGSRKRGAAPDLLDAMHRPRPGQGPNPPAPLAAGVSRAAATPSPRRVLRPSSKASPNVATTAIQNRRGCARPATPARTSSSFRGASPETSLAPVAVIDFDAPVSCPRRAPCSEVRSSLQMTEGSRRSQNPFCFRALASALSDCQPTLPQGLAKPPQPPARKVVVVKKGAVIGGSKAVGKQEDVHQLRILENSHMQYRFLNARAEAVAMAWSAAAEKSLYGLSERIAHLQESVAEKKAELECLKRVERVHSVVGSQVPFLQTWSELEAEHLSCLGRGTTAFRDAASRVPTIGNIRTNIGGVNETLQSTMKIMEELSPSVEKLSGKVEEVEDMASNLAEVVASEQILLQECADLLHQAHNMQVMEDSLRLHLTCLKNQDSRT